ncbi:hypothetical protein N1F78_13135 [Seonamhaeicola sp. MEBiC1930]|uniref:hypothetical protein n=1 Tax=Seonamhaeicola sp. MEBiC01930 TaxID=2976768 RepID=UPI00324C2EE6
MKQFFPIVLTFSFFLFTGCEDVLECIINIRPELENKSLVHGHVDEFYFESISAEIKNEPNDNVYDYYFSVSGNIPEGIELFYDYREVVFEGIPKETGRFTLRVSLTAEAIVEYYYDEFGNEYYHDPLCSNNTSRVYTLVIR